MKGERDRDRDIKTETKEDKIRGSEGSGRREG